MKFFDELATINKSYCAMLGLPTEPHDRALSESEKSARLSADEIKISQMMTEAETKTLDARRAAIFRGDMMQGRDLPGLPAATYKRGD